MIEVTRIKSSARKFIIVVANKEEKHRRMKIRRDIGNRQAKLMAQVPFHFANAYLVAHACFSCQKSFKLSQEEDRVCPECREKIYPMGRAFKAPKRGDRQQWKKVQKLYALGFRFHGYGRDYQPLPERLQEIDRFVEQYPDHELRIAALDRSLLPSENIT